MIHWNRISGVYVLGQTGQLIPLVIGIGGLIKTFYTINNERWMKSVVSWLFFLSGTCQLLGHLC